MAMADSEESLSDYWAAASSVLLAFTFTRYLRAFTVTIPLPPGIFVSDSDN